MDGQWNSRHASAQVVSQPEGAAAVPFGYTVKSRCPQVPDAVHPAGRVVVRASRDAGEHERMDLIPADINRMELFSGSYRRGDGFATTPARLS